ncbi:MAG: HIT family protein [Firmicutes bacterium]|nr:HIT family protein [Bacillota bacterium]
MEYLSVFNPDQYSIKEFEHWVVMVRYKHLTLGSCVIAPKRFVPAMSDLSTDEGAEFPIVAKWFEDTTRKLYGAEKFNYLALMMKDHFVHYHAFPRYSKAITRHGVEFQDTSWPIAIDLTAFGDYEDAIIQAIRKEMSEVSI